MSANESVSLDKINWIDWIDWIDWGKIIWGVLIGALTGMIMSLVLLPFGVRRAEWMMAACSTLGVFIGLLKMTDTEGQQPEKENQYDL